MRTFPWEVHDGKWYQPMFKALGAVLDFMHLPKIGHIILALHILI